MKIVNSLLVLTMVIKPLCGFVHLKPFFQRFLHHNTATAYTAHTAHTATANAPIPKYQPKTPNQELYVKHLTNSNVSLVVAVGPAGTGKTLLACKNAIEKLKKNQIEKIILTRPLVSVADENIGFLPGNLNNKMELWIKPMMDVFNDFFTKKDIHNLIENGVIEITPLLYMRGRTFKNTLIIADEIQNTTPTQLLMLLTRCGEGTKIIVTGDPKQSDLKEKNGLTDFMERLKMSAFEQENDAIFETVKLIEFENNDIQRSNLVKQILNMYNKRPISPPPPPKKKPLYDPYEPL